MSSHNTEAAYASAEIATIIQNRQEQFFKGIGTKDQWSLFAGREGSSKWPLADGVIFAKNPCKELNFAFEFKRANEGVHGILTALGQSYAYLEKGYNASIIAFPSHYSSHKNPGEHINRVIESTSPEIPIWIFTYDEPDLGQVRPFYGKIKCVRDISLSKCKMIGKTKPSNSTGRVTTLWAHVREGMSYPDAFFRFCQSAKIVSSIGENFKGLHFPEELIMAVKRLDPNTDIYHYLSNTASDNNLDKAWRHVWFNYYFWNDVMPIYIPGPSYRVNNVPTKIHKNPNNYQCILSPRSDSIKQKLVAELNKGNISVEKAWEKYAENVRRYAHSLREVIDSGLEHIGFVSSNGDLTELGYKYVDACERENSPFGILPMQILRAAFLQNGQYAAFLHYIFKLSEEIFEQNLYAFTKIEKKQRVFDKDLYLGWLKDYFSTNLHVLQESSERNGGTRKPLQAEIGYLNMLGLVRSDPRGHAAFKIGSGLCIDWPQVQTSLQFYNTL